MKLVPFALLLASIATAEKIPVLTEPMVFQRYGNLTLTAWKDSLAVGRYGRFDFFRRGNAGIVRGDSVLSSAIDNEQPRFFSLLDTAHLIEAKTAILSHNPTGAAPGVHGGNPAEYSLGYGYPQGGLVRESSPPGEAPAWNWRLLGCNNNHAVEISGSSRWSLADSTTFAVTSGNLLCDADPVTRQAVMMWRSTNDRILISGGNLKGLMRAAPRDTLISTASPSWVLAGWDGLWMTCDSRTRTIFHKSRTSRGIDSLTATELPAGARLSSQVAHKDSLVVFGMDSSLVVVKWTPTGVKLISTFVLPGAGNVNAVTASDSLVWVGTSSALYSFRFTWQENASTSVGTRGTALTALSLRSSGHGVELVWNGPEATTFEILAVDGRKLADLRLASGQAVTWQSDRPGVHLIRSREGSRTFVTR
ncbi:MAG: hypothetical protein RL318_313 [Fibrobacterota bacterium]|jgi:hypothetical protein